MADAYRLLQSGGSDTLARFCSDNKVKVEDVWVPLQLLCPRRAKNDTPVPVSPATAILLLEHTSGRLVTRRGDILAHIPLLFTDEHNLSLPPSAVPEDCTVFVRASKSMTKKRMIKGMHILHRPITSEQAVAEGSALVVAEETQPAQKRTRTSTRSGTQTETIVGDTEAAARRRKAKAEMGARFEEYLQKALEESRGGRGAHGGVIMKETMANLLRVRDAAPLHFVMRGKPQTSIHVKDLAWNIPDWRVLYRVFRRGGAADGASKTTYNDAARLIAVFMIDNVLIRREPMRACLQPAGRVWSVVDSDLLSAVPRLAEKGYRIVLLDHYPSLHHGNETALETKLHPIAELCRQYFSCDVTVVISTMSCISAAHRREGMPFILPYSGLWQFFVVQLNGGLRPDAESLLVGESLGGVECSRADALSQGRRDAEFARNCGLRYMDREGLKKETLLS
ncbi:uncharacterized protein Tco025E_01177 [Trypanosoma conorhini]|uniref:Uncharacterized protein n=1 Tax=Trypanosoma conorhini TaxID=83891 RepID=A0A3R7NSN9_9TRYP|nr:uncharacterized protein Tco025E_01177 [Trypanosoma conorhini]RNF26455.1 hypothetical protein Tco025E_01177 [Trypanosoma conorhini]